MRGPAGRWAVALCCFRPNAQVWPSGSLWIICRRGCSRGIEDNLRIRGQRSMIPAMPYEFFPSTAVLQVAVELAAALSESSPQLQWLRYAGPAGQTIWAEVQQQAELVGGVNQELDREDLWDWVVMLAMARRAGE